MSDNVAGKIHSLRQWWIWGRGLGSPSPPPPSFLDQTEPQRAEKMVFGSQAGSLLSQGLEASPPPPPNLKVCICHRQVKLQTKLENWMPTMLMGRLTTKLVDRLTAKLVNHLTAKLMNHLTPKLVDHLTTKLMVVNI